VTRASARDAPIAIEVIREAGDWPDRRRLRSLARRAIDAAAEEAGVRLAANAEVAIVFTDDAHMRALNQKFRGKDAATNVLSFPASPPERGAFGPLLGDIFLGYEVISTEAEGLRLKFDHHLIHLIVHGFLHLVGFDHGYDGEADLMEGRERAILGKIGIADPYAANRR
jgi:probable rRNA maturation factor